MNSYAGDGSMSPAPIKINYMPHQLTPSRGVRRATEIQSKGKVCFQESASSRKGFLWKGSIFRKESVSRKSEFPQEVPANVSRIRKW